MIVFGGLALVLTYWIHFTNWEEECLFTSSVKVDMVIYMQTRATVPQILSRNLPKAKYQQEAGPTESPF